MLLNAHCFFMSLPNDCGLAIIIIVALQICEGGNQEWVEDPTNQNPSFARNRIRLSLRNLPSCELRLICQLR